MIFSPGATGERSRVRERNKGEAGHPPPRPLQTVAIAANVDLKTSVCGGHGCGCPPLGFAGVVSPRVDIAVPALSKRSSCTLLQCFEAGWSATDEKDQKIQERKREKSKKSWKGWRGQQ